MVRHDVPFSYPTLLVLRRFAVPKSLNIFAPEVGRYKIPWSRVSNHIFWSPEKHLPAYMRWVGVVGGLKKNKGFFLLGNRTVTQKLHF
jgi:hypothetical protein